MKREKFIKKRRWLISIILTLFLAMVLAMEQAEIVFAKEGKNVTQNWAAAAVFYDTQADETETFHMTEEEFLACKTDLEARLVYAYSACLNSLPDAERRTLEDAQKAWLDCYYSYICALEQKWLGPVKIFFWSYRKREAHECIQGDCPADADQPDYGLGGMECR